VFLKVLHPLYPLSVSTPINVAIIARGCAEKIIKALVIGQQSWFKPGLGMPRQIPLLETTGHQRGLIRAGYRIKSKNL